MTAQHNNDELELPCGVSSSKTYKNESVEMNIVENCPLCKSSELATYAMKYSVGFPHLSRTICFCELVKLSQLNLQGKLY